MAGFAGRLGICAVLACAIALPALAAGARARSTRIDDLGPAQLDARAHQDAVLLRSYTLGIARLVAELRRRDDLWARAPNQALSADDRRAALELFDQVLAYEIALDGMARFHLDFWKIDVIKDPTRHARHFALGFAAYCEQLALGLFFVERTMDKPQFEKLFDEGSPDHGIPSGAYARLKWNVVHVEDVGRVFAAHQYHKLMGLTQYRKLAGDTLMQFVLDEIDRAYEETKGKLAKAGARLFAGNGLDILMDGGHSVWFPVQMEVAEWMGDTKVKRLNGSLITVEQALEAAKRSKAGDVIVERRNWYISNVGLPGFWPHAALYLGTPEELAGELDADSEVTKAFGGPFTSALAKRFPKAWAQYASKDEAGHARRVFEAVSEGVVFTSVEHSFTADYLAALRPRLPKVELARAIERAFGYAGRPYDFDFDFYTDRELVCSELVFKAYEPRDGAKGLKLELVKMVGRMTLPPNTMIGQFDRELGTPSQQLDFAWFLDGREKDERADWSDAAALRGSHRRLKWDLAQK